MMSTAQQQVKVFTSDKAVRSRTRSGSFGRTTNNNTQVKKAIAKKNGHGKKGAWGKVGSEAHDDTVMDVNDPNYIDPKEIPIDRIDAKYTVTKEDMQDFLKVPLAEFFTNGIVSEIIASIQEFGESTLHHHVVSYILCEACLRDNPERELASQLLLELVTSKLTDTDTIQRGFCNAIRQLDDLSLDTPDADHVIAKFIARGVADEILYPKYVLSFDISRKQDDDKVRRCIKKAKGLINTSQGLARLEYVWGVSGARSPVQGLVKEITLILEEYITSGSLEETANCIRKLKAAHFHHEVVYRMVLIAIESGDHKVIQMMVSLLQSIGSAGENLVSDTQLKGGLDRILTDIHDIALDVPHVKRHLASFYRLAAPCIPEDLKLTNERLYPDTPEVQLKGDDQDLDKRIESRKRSVSETAVMPPLQR